MEKIIEAYKEFRRLCKEKGANAVGASVHGIKIDDILENPCTCFKASRNSKDNITIVFDLGNNLDGISFFTESQDLVPIRKQTTDDDLTIKKEDDLPF